MPLRSTSPFAMSLQVSLLVGAGFAWGCSDGEGASPGSVSGQGGASSAGGSSSSGASSAQGGAENAGGASAGSGNAGGSGGSAGAGSGGSAGSSGNGGSAGGGSDGPRVATVETPLELLPAPGLAGPALKVDLDMSGRPTGEVTEIGYVAWPVTAGASISKEFEGVTFTFAKAGSNGTELAATWQKVAVQAPNYARLAGDGLTVSEGDAGSQISNT